MHAILFAVVAIIGVFFTYPFAGVLGAVPRAIHHREQQPIPIATVAYHSCPQFDGDLRVLYTSERTWESTLECAYGDPPYPAVANVCTYSAEDGHLIEELDAENCPIVAVKVWGRSGSDTAV